MVRSRNRASVERETVIEPCGQFWEKHSILWRNSSQLIGSVARDSLFAINKIDIEHVDGTLALSENGGQSGARHLRPPIPLYNLAEAGGRAQSQLVSLSTKDPIQSDTPHDDSLSTPHRIP